MTTPAPAHESPPDPRNWYVQVFQTVGCPVAVAALLIAWDTGWLPSASRETLPIVEAILKDTTAAVAAQRQWHDQLLAELRALRRRQAALCLVMLTQLAGKDVTAIREACVAEAMGGVP